jgi:hypothetical protein
MAGSWRGLLNLSSLEKNAAVLETPSEASGGGRDPSRRLGMTDRIVMR